MKSNLVYMLVVMLVLAFSDSSWAQFPCYPGDSVSTCCGADSSCYLPDVCGYSLDLGICDTLYVEPWAHTDTCFIAGTDTICINEPGEEFPCFWYVSLFVTHDSNTFYWEEPPMCVQDSIVAFSIPLTFWHESEGCGHKVILPTSNWLNNTKMDPGHPLFPKSMFRHIVDENGDTVFNRLAWMTGPPNYLPPWNETVDIDTLSSDGDSGYVFMSLIAASPECRRWWEGSRVLLATYTFMVYPSEDCDTIEIGLDSTLWPPVSQLSFTRYDGRNYCPRHYLPVSDTLSRRLHADFSANPTLGIVPFDVQFTDHSSGVPTSWFWYFGDDSTSTEQHPMHTYNDTGYYDVKLVVSNETETDSLIRYKYIHVFPSVVANFLADPESGFVPLQVQFTDLSGGNPTSWFWAFGDGSTDTVQNPANTYNDTGHFDVTLVASNEADTDSITKKDYIHVFPYVNDVGVSAILSPPDSIGMGFSYPLVSEVTNYGTDPQTFDVIFEVYVSDSPTIEIADTAIITEMPGDSAVDTVTFNRTLKPTLDTTYNLISYTTLVGDQNFSNDTTIATSSAYEAGAIAGVVTDEASDSIEGVYVLALNTSIDDTTDVNGEYSLNGLPVGTHDVYFTHPEYYDTTATGIMVTVGDTTILNIVLQHKPETDIGVSAILSPPESMTVGLSYPLISEVTNYGTNPQTFDAIFEVFVSGSATVEVADTLVVTAMPELSVDTFTFSDSLVPTIDTTYELISYTTLAGDENSSNDTTMGTSYSVSPDTCPEEPNDLGKCDTLYVEPWPYTDTCFIAGTDTICINEPGEQFPFFWYVSLFVTHDSNTFWWEGAEMWAQDSIGAFVIPLTFWHEPEGCGHKVILPTSDNWNNTEMSDLDPLFSRGVFRHLVDENGDTVYNRLAQMVGPPEFLPEWSVILDIDTLSSDGDSGHVFMSVITMNAECRKWWEGSRVLLATLTFMVYPSEDCDIIEIGLDSTFWPPNIDLFFVRYDALSYCPRHYLPVKDTVFLVPLANFSAEPESGFFPLEVEFTDLSSGNPSSWLWVFGDGNTDTVQNPAHTYNDTGCFDVKLIASNPAGSDTMIKPHYIAVFETLTVDLTAEPTQGRKPLNVSFQSLCNPIPPYNVTWYFGDGDSSNDLNPVHQYTEVDSFDVKLVAELFGYKDSLTKENYILVSDIKAEFAADKRCGSAPLMVAFSDSSTGTYTITGWDWDFDDGETSDQQDPTHEFQDTGVFDITLIASDGIGTDTLTKEGYITTQDSVSADFIGFPLSVRPGDAVVFEPILEGIANEYFWEFGDGDTSNLRNPIHTYTAQGKYHVKLRVRLELDTCSQVDSMIKENYVIVNDLEAQFSANPTAGVAPLEVHFTDESSGDPDTWFWDFGDETTSPDSNPSHWYDTAGIYHVFLRVSNSIGVDSLLKLSYILVTDTLYADLFAEIYDPGGARPGFDLWFCFVWTNIGTTPAENCTLKILLPSQMNFDTLTPGEINTGTYSGYDSLGDTIRVPLETIDPSEWYGGYVYAYGNLPETVQIGDTLICEMWFTSTTSDENYDNNYVLHFLEVTGSIDPNDKLAYPGGQEISYPIEPDQRLEYIIRFENKPEATAEAIYIRVVDTLDQDLDWGTLAIGALSHPDECDNEFDPYSGVIMWFCDSIMLPPNENPPEGEGYFTFSISPERDLPEGTEIANSAWIRFDYNEWLQAPEEGPVIRTVYSFIRGDANGDDVIDIGDVIYLINYLFTGTSAPDPLWVGDCNCDGIVDIGDVIYLINYLFLGTAPPGC